MMHGTCWACMQCKLTYKQKHANYKKLTKFRLYNRNCTIVHKLSINGVTKVAKERCSPFIGCYKHTRNFFKVKVGCFFPMYMQK